MKTREFLLEHLIREAADFWGETDVPYLTSVAEDWLDTTGRSGSAWRLDTIRTLFPATTRILDMGAGCGTFVHFALRQGFDASGIEPEAWKITVASLQAETSDCYPQWCSRILPAFGEELPFTDNSFDCVATFQTIEHVQDVAACCREMVRVVRPGGGIHLRCPDYALSTWEGHYRLPWLPGLKGGAAEHYLKAWGKPFKGLHSLQPVSFRKIKTIFTSIASETGVSLRVVDLDYRKMLRILRLGDTKLGYLVTRPVSLLHYLRFFFHADFPVHMAVYVDKK